VTGTELEHHRNTGGAVALFPGATAGEIIAVAADAAAQFSDVVKRQRMFKRIGQNDHIQIEAWQTIGALTGVLADEGHVTELPWPQIEPLGDEPPQSEKAAHDAWKHHRDLLQARAVGRAYGFKAEFRAAKAGVGVGWGEGRCTRSEPSKVNQEDYALASMAQTRGQSRALGAPLKFVVKLAGYETTPAEELDSPPTNSPTASASAPLAAPWGPVADDAAMQQAAQAVASLRDGLEGEPFVAALAKNFDGVPQAAVTALRGLAKYVAAFDAKRGAEAVVAAEGASEAPVEDPGPDPQAVYPPGRYQGD
jgi:hypothetical protein